MFETVFSAMGEGVVIQDGNAEIIAVNPAAERMLGIAAADLIGRPVEVVASAVKLIHEDGSECPWDHYPAVVTARTGQPQHDEVRGVYRPDGTLVWLAVSTRPLRPDGDGTAYPVAAIFRDITEHKRTEEALYFISQRGWRRRAESLHKFAEQRERFRSHILEMLSGGGSLPDILEGIVRGVEQLGSGMICSILLREGGRLGHGIAPSLPDFYNAAIDGVEIGIGIGSCGTAAASGQRVVVEDIRTHPYWASFKELAAKAGLGSCWSQPVLSSSGQVLGTFAIYHREVHTPTASDIFVIEQAAHLASIAIERKLGEQQLKQALEFSEGIINAIPDILFEMDRNGTYLNVWTQNPELLAAHKQALLGKSVHEVLSPEAAAAAMDAIREADENGTAIGKDICIDLPQGRFWFSHSLAKKPGNTSSDATFMVLARDITERKQAELERQVYARSLECMDWINKAIQGTTDLDQMMRDVLDIVLSSFEADRAFLLYPCDPDVDEWQVPMERTRPEYPGALALGITAMPMNSETATIVRITRDAGGPVMFGPGAEYPLPPNSSKNFGFKSEILMAVHPKLGKPWIFGIHQCAHAKVWTENEVDLFQKIGWRLSDALTSLLMYRDLRASEQQFRTLAENYPDILIRYDREGRRTYVNPAMEQMFAVTEKQTIGLSTLEANPLRLPEAYQQALQHTLATGERSEFEMELPLSSGEVRTGFIYIVAERAMDGSISGAITIGRDITRLKQTEQQLRELAAHLQTVREEEKARLARELHDDLGQILFLLKMRVSYVHDSATDSGPWREHLQDALLLTERAMGTARNIVSALRPPALDFGIAAALKWLAENFVSNMHISCGVHVAEDESRIDDSKALALFRIVQEALNNVAKHAQADRVEISLFKDATDYVLTVRDNGIGFDKDKKKIGSFGLVGMQERALMHGGSVAIDSRPGSGTEISVRIPEGMKRE